MLLHGQNAIKGTPMLCSNLTQKNTRTKLKIKNVVCFL